MAHIDGSGRGCRRPAAAEIARARRQVAVARAEIGLGRALHGGALASRPQAGSARLLGDVLTGLTARAATRVGAAVAVGLFALVAKPAELLAEVPDYPHAGGPVTPEDDRLLNQVLFGGGAILHFYCLGTGIKSDSTTVARGIGTMTPMLGLMFTFLWNICAVHQDMGLDPETVLWGNMGALGAGCFSLGALALDMQRNSTAQRGV
ncbi:MAG: hypothetical protein HY696_04550 [Deltaproteobacteria bacterium]|nr:hypothetical protein [Deltaproteobacteria bacterium]